jgi:hypothetical protein
MSRNAWRARERTNTTINPTIGSDAKAMSDMRTSSSSIMTTMPTSVTRSPMALSTPEAKSSLTASTSFVARVTRRPTGVLS